MQPRRFLFALWDGGGTAPPELAVASRLVRRGHEVRVLADPSMASDVAAAGASFSPWQDAPHRTSRAPEADVIREWEARTPLGAFARARDRHAFRPANLFAREVTLAFDSRPADAVVVDGMLFGALVGAEATKAPVAALIPMTSFLPAPGMPPPGLGIGRARGPLGHLRDKALYTLGDAIIWRPCTRWLNRARAEVGLGPLHHPLDQLRRVQRVLVQTSAWFDFDAPPARDNVRYVGPELGDPAWASSEVPPGDGLVLVAFSTTYMQQTAIVQRIIDALGELPVQALVTVGPSLDPSVFTAPANVKVCASVAHSQVLPRARLVITHGGHGTVIRALAEGVPLVCIPMGRDQGDNAARVVAAGAGVRVSRHAGVGKLRRTIEGALRDPALREGARRAREHIAAEHTGDLVIEELEAL